jgi:hypothetical protein
MLKYATVTNGSPGRCFQQQDLDMNGVANSGNGIPPCCSGFNVQRSAKELLFCAKKRNFKLHESSCYLLISFSDKDFEFPNFQIPPTLARRVSAQSERLREKE